SLSLSLTISSANGLLVDKWRSIGGKHHRNVPPDPVADQPVVCGGHTHNVRGEAKGSEDTSLTPGSLFLSHCRFMLVEHAKNVAKRTEKKLNEIQTQCASSF